MHKYPSKVEVGGNTLDIKLIDGAHTNTDASNFADLCYQKNEIRVATKCADGSSRCLDFLNESLVHEFVEVIKIVYALEKLEECDVERIAQGFWQILKQYGMKLIKEDCPVCDGTGQILKAQNDKVKLYQPCPACEKRTLVV